MVQNLEGMGFTVVPFGQGFKDMSPPTKELMKLVLEKRVAHGGHPVNSRSRDVGMRIDADDALDRVDRRDPVRAAAPGCLRRRRHARHVWRELGLERSILLVAQLEQSFLYRHLLYPLYYL